MTIPMIALKILVAIVAIVLLAFFAIVNHDRRRARRVRRNYERLEIEWSALHHTVRDPAAIHRNAQKAIDQSEDATS